MTSRREAPNPEATAGKRRIALGRQWIGGKPMTLRVSGKNIDIGDSLRTYVGARLDLVVLKYAAEPTGGHVTIEREGSGFRTDCTLHLRIRCDIAGGRRGLRRLFELQPSRRPDRESVAPAERSAAVARRQFGRTRHRNCGGTGRVPCHQFRRRSGSGGRSWPGGHR